MLSWWNVLTVAIYYLWLKFRPFKQFTVCKIEVLSNRNLFLWQIEAICQKIAAPWRPTFVSHCTTGNGYYTSVHVWVRVWLCTQISNQWQPAMTFGEYSKFKESERCDRFMPRKRSAKSHPEVTVSLCHFFPSYWWVNMSKCIGIWRRFRMYSWCWQYAWQSLPNQRGNWRYTDTSQTSINLVNQRGNWRSWRSGVCHKTPELYVSGPATVSQCCLMDWTACCDVYCGFVYTSACRTHKCEKIYISKMAQCKKWVFRISSIFLWCICDEYLVNTLLRLLTTSGSCVNCCDYCIVGYKVVFFCGMTKYRVDHVDRVDHIITASTVLKRPN